MDVPVRALETIPTEKGYVDPAPLDRIVEAFEPRIGRNHGAAVVAHAAE
jgi:nitrile hydratase subunit alpha